MYLFKSLRPNYFRHMITLQASYIRIILQIAANFTYLSN